MDKKKDELQGLTIARFFAAIAVVLFHFREDLGNLPRFAEAFASSGYTCVSFFFVLSGFVLVYAAHNRKFDTQDFLIRRVARLWPVYAFAWGVFGVGFVLWDDMTGTTFVAAGLTLVGLQSWVPSMGFRWNMPAWSLSAEAFFYLSFPLLYRHMLGVSSRALWGTLLAMFALNTAHLYLIAIPPDFFGSTPFATRWSWENYASILPPFRIPQFVAGIALGLLYLRKVQRVPWLLPVSLAASMALWCVPNHYPVPRDIWLFPLYCALIYSLAWVKTSGALGRLGLLLGRASYSIYILHIPLWAFWSHLMEASPLRFFSFCVLITLASIAVYEWLERPAEKWIRTRMTERPNETLVPEPR